MIVNFNWRAIPLVVTSLASGGLVGLGLGRLGVAFEVALGAGVLLAGAILIVVDYFFWRRRNAPLLPYWRLLVPAAGAHVLFVPCWLFGAVGILIAGLALAESQASASRSFWSSALSGLAFAGFIVPGLFEYFRPIELLGPTDPWFFWKQ